MSIMHDYEIYVCSLRILGELIMILILLCVFERLFSIALMHECVMFWMVFSQYDDSRVERLFSPIESMSYSINSAE